MENQKIYNDSCIILSLGIGPDNIQLESGDKTKKQWTCHKRLLIRHSTYFSYLLSHHFIESQAPKIYLPLTIVSNHALDLVLFYLETDQIQYQTIRDLCDIYCTADYLGIHILLCKALLLLEKEMHHFNCHCSSCKTRLPHLVHFCKERPADDESIQRISNHLQTLITQDPDRSLNLWCQRAMIPHWKAQYQPMLLSQVNKTNAIEVHHATYLALDYFITHDPLLVWSQPLHGLVRSLQSSATGFLADHFDFYCCEYPTLLSCIDGVIYSPDYLEYLLTDVLAYELNPKNIGTFYLGITLLLKRSMSPQVKSILNVAKKSILLYTSQYIKSIRQHKGLEKLEISVLKILARELDICSMHLVNDTEGQQQTVRRLKRYIKKNTYFCSIRQCTSLLKRATTWNNDTGQMNFFFSSPMPRKSLKKAKMIVFGDRVVLQRCLTGSVLFIGRVHFSKGIWIGVELDKRVGQNDGRVFVRPQDIVAVE
ncbi:unnamed protein product [Rhizopus stolonifer]